MAQPQWAAVLSFLYSHTGEFNVEADVEIRRTEFGEDHDARETQQEYLHQQLSGETGIDAADLEAILGDLVRVNLLHRSLQDNSAAISLTERGFDVAHERELNNRQQSLNRSLVILTAGLVFGAVAQAIGAYFNTPLPFRNQMGTMLIVVGVLIILTIAVIYWDLGGRA